MAQANIEIISDEALKADLAKYLRRKVFPEVLKNAAKEAEPIILEYFAESIMETKAIQGLLGYYAGEPEADVQAHLGLNDITAETAVNAIRKNIYQSLKSKSFKVTDGALTFGISINRLKENLLGLSEGTYASSDKKGDTTEIPWLRWLLDGSGPIDADISFNVPVDFEPRSGRAYMINAGHPTFGGWDIEDYDNFSDSNQNFLVDAIENESFINNARTTIKLLIANQFKRIKK